MDDRDFRETARNVRSKDFLAARAADFSSIPAATQMIADLTAAVAKVEQEYQRQLATGGDARQAYAVYKDALQDLLAEMYEIRDFADSMSRVIPGLEKKFRVPRGGKAEKIAAAYVFADDAELIKQTFLDYGMDKNFIENLRMKADHTTEAKAAAEAATGGRVGSTSALGQDVDDASDIVEAIDPIVRRVYRSDPANLAAWIHASHVERHTPAPQPPKP